MDRKQDYWYRKGYADGRRSVENTGDITKSSYPEYPRPKDVKNTGKAGKSALNLNTTDWNKGGKLATDYLNAMCPACKGTGDHPYFKTRHCPKCNGTGKA